MTERRVTVGSVVVGEGLPLALIGGPCVIESEAMAHRIAASLAASCRALGVPFVFKASFDKANRTRGDAFRGPGLIEGLRILGDIGKAYGIPVTTDVHQPDQADAVAAVVDLLQIPAFLCRQTDLLIACGRTGRPVNVKKGQFVAPRDMAYAVDKLRDAGAGGVILTERGTTFGYGDLVVDMRAFAEMSALGVPVCFDATHSVQRPGGGRTGGAREHIPGLSRAAVAAGADLVFAEIHEDPAQALSDAESQWPLVRFDELIGPLLRIRAAR